MHISKVSSWGWGGTTLRELTVVKENRTRDLTKLPQYRDRIFDDAK